MSRKAFLEPKHFVEQKLLVTFIIRFMLRKLGKYIVAETIHKSFLKQRKKLKSRVAIAEIYKYLTNI